MRGLIARFQPKLRLQRKALALGAVGWPGRFFRLGACRFLAGGFRVAPGFSSLAVVAPAAAAPDFFYDLLGGKRSLIDAPGQLTENTHLLSPINPDSLAARAILIAGRRSTTSQQTGFPYLPKGYSTESDPRSLKT
ncbi:MAG TPA: hypothetical protein VN924_10530 [Bryobacteraceae bacterium]|jgi:hypothetical protein|nr:hypothetical protein [Bryobacteraceae bacterium]